MDTPLIQVRNLTKEFEVGGGFLKKAKSFARSMISASM